MKEFLKRIVSNTTFLKPKSINELSINNINTSSNKHSLRTQTQTPRSEIKKINNNVSSQSDAENLRYLIDSSTTQSDIFNSIIRKGKKVSDNLFPDSENKK